MSGFLDTRLPNELIAFRQCFSIVILEAAACCRYSPVLLSKLFNGNGYVTQDMGTVSSNHTSLH